MLSILKTIFLTFVINSSVMALSTPLYPEDGSMNMNYWYYSGGSSGPRVPAKIINAIESSFTKEGVIPVTFPKYVWIQDILFFNQTGQFVEMPNLPLNEDYFSDVTMGVFESFGWGAGELTRLSKEDFQLFDKTSEQLAITFLEGGATITGKFKDGADYVIVNQSRFDDISIAYRDMINSNASNDEILTFVTNELKIKKENLFLINKKAGTEHLDLYMKALPGGVLLLDDPDSRLEIAKKFLKSTDSNVLNRIRAYEENPHNSYGKMNERRRVNIIKELLGDKFEIHLVSGRFFTYYTNVNGVTTYQERINFFNGVSGLNKSNRPFYITNDALDAKGLEDYWSEQLLKFGFAKENIHYPGDYSNGSGLDCMGSPSL